MKPTPMQSIVIGMGGMILFGWMMLSLFVLDPPGRLTADSVKVVTGKLAKAVEMGGKRRDLDVWIDGQEIPFRSFDSVYPRSYDRDVLATLRPGMEVRVSVEIKDADSPRRNLAQNQPFFPLVALELDGKPALTLEAYNQWSAENQKVAQWFLPLMFCGCAYLGYSGIKARKVRSGWV
jgi:hypothetical protein